MLVYGISRKGWFSCTTGHGEGRAYDTMRGLLTLESKSEIQNARREGDRGWDSICPGGRFLVARAPSLPPSALPFLSAREVKQQRSSSSRAAAKQQSSSSSSSSSSSRRASRVLAQLHSAPTAENRKHHRIQLLSPTVTLPPELHLYKEKTIRASAALLQQIATNHERRHVCTRGPTNRPPSPGCCLDRGGAGCFEGHKRERERRGER